jgi:hypothetical protein
MERKAGFRFRLVIIVVMAALTLVAVRAQGASAQSANDVARFLAGLPPSSGSQLGALTHQPGWQRHATDMNAGWAQFERNIAARIQVWARAKLPPSPPAMFYMFGGPDFPHANAFFPESKVYILSGLEPIGSIPGLSTLKGRDLSGSFQSLRTSLDHYFQFGYFITKDMNKQLKAGKFTGTLPLLYVFLARSGKAIREVKFVNLAGGGNVAPPGNKYPRGVRITFTGKDGRPRQLYYFNTDLSNGGIAKSSFLTFCAKQGRGGALIKSGSYLLHNAGFTRVRDFLLQHSAVIVQDDTGIPFRYFKPGAWRLRAFGQYVEPIPVFKAHYQKDMAAFFARSAERVNFGIGYHSHPTRTGILVAEKIGPQ